MVLKELNFPFKTNLIMKVCFLFVAFEPNLYGFSLKGGSWLWSLQEEPDVLGNTALHGLAASQQLRKLHLYPVDT